MDSQSTDKKNSQQAAMRFPIRMRWSIIIALTVILALLMQFYVFMQTEKKAWLEQHLVQENLHVDQLVDTLKIPMLSNNHPDVEYIVSKFLSRIPDALGVYLHYTDDSDQAFGSIDFQQPRLHEKLHSMIDRGEDKATRDREWHIHEVIYNGQVIGSIVVQFSFETWEKQFKVMLNRLMISVAVALVISLIVVYTLAGNMSKPLEMLSLATKKVAQGDYSIHLSGSSNDEVGDAIEKFNALVRELKHKERLRHSFGRYLNPEVVSDVLKTGEISEITHRKQVTALFADMVGFTKYSHSVPTEEIVNVLNRYFEIFHRIIHYYGGHIDKYIGDALLAIFNHPGDDPNHAFHASLAGIAITMATEKIGMLNAEGEKISFRVALNQGPVIIGNIGAVDRLEYTVIGDAVNVASRIVRKGNGDELMMSHSCYAKINNPALQFINHGTHEIKGLTQTIQYGSVYILDEKITQELEYVVDMAINPSENNVYNSSYRS